MLSLWVKARNIKFHENSTNESHYFLYGRQMDEWPELLLSSYFSLYRYIVYRKLWIPVSHPFGIVELFPGSIVTENLRSLVSSCRIRGRSPSQLLHVTRLCLEPRTILHARNTSFWQRQSLLPVTMQPWISDSPARRRPNFHTCYTCQLHFPLFTTLRTGAFGEVKIQRRHTLKLLYTNHTHQNYAKHVDYEIISLFKGPNELQNRTYKHLPDTLPLKKIIRFD